MTQTYTYPRLTGDEVVGFYPFFERAVHELFPEYTELTRTYFTEADYTLAWMKRVIASKDKIAYLAKRSEKVIGFILFNKVYGGVSGASWLAVSPSDQNQGIGTELLKCWEIEALDQHAHALQLWTTDKNRAFYEKRGFRHGGTFPQAWFGVDMPLMYKPIGQPAESAYLSTYLQGKKFDDSNH